jgi:hypothetical protein
VLLAQEQAESAEPLYREAVAGFELALGKDHARSGSARGGLGRTLTKLARYAEAEAELLEAQRVLTTAQGITAERKQLNIKALIDLYTAWESADPDQGHAAQAAAWSAR